ncbi:hypothetical protein [Martelella radicis]|uniref:Uncharacterized protein n=1 Tax=Martelella radicis TaxID=1397476 RepID=A0A7W6KHV2_9HYPH|nr:hypothetical protein [Martelella radicis]MBB4120215.1 hypothetical protein [Martelella radicis]
MSAEIKVGDEVMLKDDPYVYRVASILNGEAVCLRGGGKVKKTVKIGQLKKHNSSGPMGITLG